MSSGSAPLNPEVHAYMKAIMCCPLIQAYGQTENTASILYGSAYDSIYGALAQICVNMLSFRNLQKSNFVIFQRCDILHKIKMKMVSPLPEDRFGLEALKYSSVITNYHK